MTESLFPHQSAPAAPSPAPSSDALSFNVFFFFFLSFLDILIGSELPDQGSNLRLLQSKCEILATGSPGKSQGCSS